MKRPSYIRKDGKQVGQPKYQIRGAMAMPGESTFVRPSAKEQRIIDQYNKEQKRLAKEEEIQNVMQNAPAIKNKKQAQEYIRMKNKEAYRGPDQLRQTPKAQGKIAKAIDVAANPGLALDIYRTSGTLPDYFADKPIEGVTGALDLPYMFTGAGMITTAGKAAKDIPSELAEGNYLGAGLDATMLVPGVKSAKKMFRSPVKKLPKQPTGKMEGLGTAKDVRNANPNIKEIRDPETGKIQLTLYKEDYFGNDWETMAPGHLQKYGIQYIDPLKGGYTDVPQFNQQLNQLRATAQFGKRPLLSRADFAVGEKEAMVDRLLYENARNVDIEGLASSENINKLFETAKQKGIAPDDILKRIVTKLAYKKGLPFQEPMILNQNPSIMNRNIIRSNPNYEQLFNKNLNEMGPMGGRFAGEENAVLMNQIRRYEQMAKDFPEQEEKIRSKISSMYNKMLKGYSNKGAKKYTGIEALQRIEPNKIGGSITYKRKDGGTVSLMKRGGLDKYQSLNSQVTDPWVQELARRGFGQKPKKWKDVHYSKGTDFTLNKKGDAMLLDNIATKTDSIVPMPKASGIGIGYIKGKAFPVATDPKRKTDVSDWMKEHSTIYRDKHGAVMPYYFQKYGGGLDKYQIRGAQTPEAWEKEIRAVERKIGDPTKWTQENMDELQNKLNEYKNWRENTPQGRAVIDYHNEPNEYVVFPPAHLNKEKYNMKRALELGYAPNEEGHWPSVDYESGEYLKSKKHDTAWKEYLYGYVMNPEQAINYDVVVNPEGYFGEDQLQYVPKKAFGGQHANFKIKGSLNKYQARGAKSRKKSIADNVVYNSDNPYVPGLNKDIIDSLDNSDQQGYRRWLNNIQKTGMTVDEYFNEYPDEDTYRFKIIDRLNPYNAVPMAKGGPIVSVEGFKKGPPPKGSYYRIPSNVLYNPTDYTIEAIADTGERKILKPHTGNTTFRGAKYVDEYNMPKAQTKGEVAMDPNVQAVMGMMQPPSYDAVGEMLTKTLGKTPEQYVKGVMPKKPLQKNNSINKTIKKNTVVSKPKVDKAVKDVTNVVSVKREEEDDSSRGVGNFLINTLAGPYAPIVESLSDIYKKYERRFQDMFMDEPAEIKTKVEKPKVNKVASTLYDNFKSKDMGYREKGKVVDAYSPNRTDSLVKFSHGFDADKGALYKVGDMVAELKNPKTPSEYKGVKAVAHFIRNGTIKPTNDPELMEPYHSEHGSTIASTSPNKFLSSPTDKTPEDYAALYKQISPDVYRITYKKQKEISKQDRKDFPDGFNPQTGQPDLNVKSYRFADIDFEGNGPSTGWLTKTNFLPLKKNSYTWNRQKANLRKSKKDPQTYLPYKDKDAFSRFSGASVIFAFKDPETGKKLNQDFSGSINEIKDFGNYLMEQYKLKPDNLDVLHHDTGSYSAKPAAKDGKLNYKQWKDFNKIDRGRSGAPIMIIDESYTEQPKALPKNQTQKPINKKGINKISYLSKSGNQVSHKAKK